MSFLGWPWEDFVRDTEHIRQEYAFVPRPDFDRGRAGFLEGLLERRAIYHLEPFQASLESRARSNLSRSAAALRAAAQS